MSFKDASFEVTKKKWGLGRTVGTGHTKSLKKSANTLKTQKQAYKSEIKKERDKIEKNSTDKLGQKRSGIIKANVLRMDSIVKQKGILTKARDDGIITPEKYDKKIAELLNYVSRQSVSTYRKRDIIAKYIPGIKKFRSYANSDLYKNSIFAISQGKKSENKLQALQNAYKKKVANETQKSIDAQMNEIQNIQAFGNTYAKADYGSKSGMKIYKKSLALAKKTATNSVKSEHKSYGLNKENSNTIKSLKNAVITRMQAQQALGTEKEAVYKGANKWKLGWWNPLAYLPNKTYIKKSTDQATKNAKNNAQNTHTLETLSSDVNIASTKAELLENLLKNSADNEHKKAIINANAASTNAHTAYGTQLTKISQKLKASLIQLPPPLQAPAQAPDATAAIIKPFGINEESKLRNLQIKQIKLQQLLLKQNITEAERNELQKKITAIAANIHYLNTQKLSFVQSSLPIASTSTLTQTTTIPTEHSELQKNYEAEIAYFQNQIANLNAAIKKDPDNLNLAKVLKISRNSLEKDILTATNTYNARIKQIDASKQLANDNATRTFASNTHNNLDAPPKYSDSTATNVIKNTTITATNQKLSTQVNTLKKTQDATLQPESNQHTRKNLTELQADKSDYKKEQNDAKAYLNKLKTQLHIAKAYTKTTDTKKYITNLTNLINYHETMIDLLDKNIAAADLKINIIDNPNDETAKTQLPELFNNIDATHTESYNLSEKLKTLNQPTQPTLKNTTAYNNIALKTADHLIKNAHNNIERITIAKKNEHSLTEKQLDKFTKDILYHNSRIASSTAYKEYITFKTSLFNKKLTTNDIEKLHVLKSKYDNAYTFSLDLSHKYTTDLPKIII